MLFSLLLAVAPAFAKDPCKVMQHVADPLNGDSVGYVQYFDIGHYTAMDIQWVKGVWKMHLLTVARGALSTNGKQGEMARFAVGGKVVELPATSDSPPVSNVTESEVFTQWRVEYDLSQEQLATLASAPIEAISMFVAGNESRMPIEGKDITRLQTAFTCALAVK